MTKRKRIGVIFCGLLFGYLQVGCEGPENLGRFRATPVTNIILDELGVIDEDSAIFSGAREPLPRDLIPDESEYVIGPGDIVDITIYELFGPGQEWIGRKQVSEVGRITIPEIGTFRASGKTELELTETIQNLLSPRIVKEPMVTVVVSGPRKKVYSITGAVAASGPYVLSENDFRISRALAAAGVVPQVNADYAYIIRTGGVLTGESGLSELESMSGEMDIWFPGEFEAVPGTKATELEGPLPDLESVIPVPPLPPPRDVPPQPAPVKPKDEQDELLESITPMPVATPMVEIKGGNSYGAVAINFNFQSAGTMTEMYRQAAQQALQGVGKAMPGGPPNGAAAPTGAGAATNGVLPPSPAVNQEPPLEAKESQSLSGWRLERKGNRFELVPETGAAPLELDLEDTEPYQQDGDIPKEPGRGKFTLPQGEPPPPGLEMGWEEAGIFVPQQEVIQVDLKKLRGGDWMQNIVIRAGDDIQIPYNATGIYSVMGQVARPGAYSLAGQRLTLKQVISTAGPLTAVAWPSRCEIIRRVGESKEVTYLVNLDKLFSGTAPDLFIKPNDIINVGSHPIARWAAVVRNSFRSTYGFGFVYDRNFADKDFGN